MELSFPVTRNSGRHDACLVGIAREYSGWKDLERSAYLGNLGELFES